MQQIKLEENSFMRLGCGGGRGLLRQHGKPRSLELDLSYIEHLNSLKMRTSLRNFIFIFIF